MGTVLPGNKSRKPITRQRSHNSQNNRTRKPPKSQCPLSSVIPCCPSTAKKPSTTRRSHSYSVLYQAFISNPRKSWRTNEIYALFHDRQLKCVRRTLFMNPVSYSRFLTRFSWLFRIVFRHSNPNMTPTRDFPGIFVTMASPIAPRKRPHKASLHIFFQCEWRPTTQTASLTATKTNFIPQL